MIDEYIQQILNSAIPINESIKSSDFTGSVHLLQEKIIDLFRFTSIQLAPSFLNQMIKYIQEDVCSQDKRKRFASAVAVSALMQLYPFDEYVPQFKIIIEKLIVPGYKPLVQIGSIVVGRLARIRGPNRDFFLKELVNTGLKELKQIENIDSRYAFASIWKELALNAPEHFFPLGATFSTAITSSLLYCDRNVNEILINTLECLFNSESAALGTDFLAELHNVLLFSTIKNFGEVKNIEEIIITYQLIHVIIKIKPFISNRNAENLLIPICISHLNLSNYEIVFLSIKTLFLLFENKIINISSELYEKIFNLLFDWVLKKPLETQPLIHDLIVIFKKFDIKSIQLLIQKFSFLLINLNSSIAAPLVFDLMISSISAFPSNNTNISMFISFFPNILNKAGFPIPIHRLLKELNRSYPIWCTSFFIFRNQLIQIIKQELMKNSQLTDRVVISLLSLSQFPELDYQNSISFIHLVLKQTKCQDIEVRKHVPITILSLFQHLKDQIPLNIILELVKFALDDPSRSVRINSLKAFKENIFLFISQQDIFPLFCRFINDESYDVRKLALNIIQKIPVIDYSLMRKIFLESLNQLNPNLSLVLPTITPIWLIFPHLLDSISSILPIYAVQVYDKFFDLLQKRFQRFNEKSLVFTNSAILKDVDSCLIKSISKLYILCPTLIPIDPIIEMFLLILQLPVHPWTKIEGLKAIKRLVIHGVKLNNDIMTPLISIITSNMSSKLVIKTLKVIGSLGFTEYPKKIKKSIFVYRSTFLDSQSFKNYFLNIIFKYLIKQFNSVNVLSIREAIFHCSASIFHLEPSIIPQFLSPFFKNCL